MKIIRCTKGHFYNGGKYSECPECARINGQGLQTMSDDDDLEVDTIDGASMFRIQEKYVYCPRCQAMEDKIFSQCPRCGATTQNPMRCDEKLLSTLLRHGELKKYERYIWTPTEKLGELKALTLEKGDRDLHIRGQKLLFDKKSSAHMGSVENRLVLDLSTDDLQLIQQQLDRTPFSGWVTPISALNHQEDMGDTSTDFYLECKDGSVFTYAGDYRKAPGYQKLSAQIWNIVTSSPDYFPELDKDPAYDDKLMIPEYCVSLYCKNTDMLLKSRSSVYEELWIVNDRETGIGFANSGWDRSLCSLFCKMGMLYLRKDAAVCIEKEGKWLQITEDTALEKGDRFRIKDIIISVKSFAIRNPDAKECGVYHRRRIARAVENEILGEIDRESLRQNIENVCHILVGYQGNLREGTDGERKKFPTAGFDPGGILYKIRQKAEYDQYMESIEMKGRCSSDLLAVEVLAYLSYYIWMEGLMEEPMEEEENEHIRNYEILKLLLRLDDLLVPWLKENDRMTGDE